MRKTLSLAVIMTAFFLPVLAQDVADSVRIGNLTEFSPEGRNQEIRYTKAMGDSAYMQEDYTRAIEIYEALLHEGESAVLYYNLGGSYYKNHDIAHAILNYERAHLLDPGDEDISANLEIARLRTVDRVDEIPDLFFVSWYKSLVAVTSDSVWAIWAIAFFILALVLAAMFFICQSFTLRKAGLMGALASLALCILFNCLAAGMKSMRMDKSHAIVMQPSVTVRTTPSESGTSAFVLHEGRKVQIHDDSMKEWKEIHLEDGKVGWVPVSAIERI